MSPAELDLVRQGVQAYEGLREDLARSVPFWPLGMPTSLDPVVVLGLRAPSATYVYVWFTHPGEHPPVVLDLLGVIGDLEVVYPTSLGDWEITWDHADRLTVAPDVSGLSARVIRIGRS
jgi:alpha-galactosidase